MKCFFHRGDFDGKCAGAIVKLAYPDCEMIGVEYGEAFPWESISKDEKVFMVDFCLEPFEDMIRLSSLSILTWIDHHKSAIEARDRVEKDMDPFAWEPFRYNGVQQVGQAACEMAWDYFNPDKPMPYAVHLLGRYDVWDLKDPQVLAFQYGMRSAGLKFWPTDVAGWERLFFDTRMVRDFIDRGRVALDYEAQYSARYLREFGFAAAIVIGDMYCMAYCLNRGLANSMCFAGFPLTQIPVAVLCAYVQLPDGRWRVSLYRPEGGQVDCAQIAEAFGGGGHAGAAGFICDNLDWMQRVAQ